MRGSLVILHLLERHLYRNTDGSGHYLHVQRFVSSLKSFSNLRSVSILVNRINARHEEAISYGLLWLLGFPR